MVAGIVGVAVGVAILVGGALLFICKCCRKYHKRREKDLSRQFKGLAGNPAFAAAIQQSFANQTASTSAILNSVESTYALDEEYSECFTCKMIEDGSSMAYSDNTCPQCGKFTPPEY